MLVNNQQGSVKKNYPLKLNIKAVCIRFSNLVILNTVSSQVPLQCVSACFETRVLWFLNYNSPTDFNFNMNKRQGTLFNFNVKKSRTEGVCDATNNDSSTSGLQCDLQDVKKEGKTTSAQEKKSAFTRKYMDSYCKFGFIQCPDTGSRWFLFTEFSFRYYCSSLEDVVVWKVLSRTWGSPETKYVDCEPFCWTQKTAISHEETLQIIELSSDKGLESTFNSVSDSKIWIRMKNEYSNLHEIAMRFLLCFSTTYLCETAFSAKTVLKWNRGTACNFLTLSVWLSLQFIPELIS